MAFLDSDGNFFRQNLQSFHSLLFARLNPPPKLGKYGGGVKSEILNATEEKVKAEMNILQKMIFTEEEETGFENHTF